MHGRGSSGVKSCCKKNENHLREQRMYERERIKRLAHRHQCMHLHEYPREEILSYSKKYFYSDKCKGPARRRDCDNHRQDKLKKRHRSGDRPAPQYVTREPQYPNQGWNNWKDLGARLGVQRNPGLADHPGMIKTAMGPSGVPVL